ncbi:MAG: radical SAM protein [Anaerolineales bacterium]
MPTDQKVCSFDCLYCQYGRTNTLIGLASRNILPSIDEVLTAVKKALGKPRTIDFVTFSGNGESTLHPDFSQIVEGVKAIKDELRKDVRLAILSNSSRVMDKDVSAALQLFDAPMMKLDAGDEETFQAINRPIPNVHLDDIISGLQSIPNLMIQSMLIDGHVTNVRGESYEAWALALSELHPLKVHIYSTERPTADDSVKNVSPNKLEWIANDLRKRFELEVTAFW